MQTYLLFLVIINLNPYFIVSSSQSKRWIIASKKIIILIIRNTLFAQYFIYFFLLLLILSWILKSIKCDDTNFHFWQCLDVNRWIRWFWRSRMWWLILAH